jgi:alpha-tubulin suppressor-like RCC1 family protein
MNSGPGANDEFSGLLVRTTNGNLIQNPLVGIRRRAAEDMVKLGVQFGMTPASRKRLGIVTPSNEPVDVSNIADAIQVSAGHYHTCAVRAGGEVMCWGWRANGRIGDGNTINNSMTPTPVTGIADALQVSAGDSHTCVVHQAGDVSCWGSNVSGQLGDGTQIQRVLPMGVPGISAVQVSAGHRHTCAVLSDGTADCWGSQNNGRLGNDETFDNALSPDPVHLLTGVVQIAAGYWGSCAASALGAIYCWGEGQQGLLGTGSSVDQAEPSGPLAFP